MELGWKEENRSEKRRERWECQSDMKGYVDGVRIEQIWERQKGGYWKRRNREREIRLKWIHTHMKRIRSRTKWGIKNNENDRWKQVYEMKRIIKWLENNAENRTRRERDANRKEIGIEIIYFAKEILYMHSFVYAYACV